MGVYDFSQLRQKFGSNKMTEYQHHVVVLGQSLSAFWSAIHATGIIPGPNGAHAVLILEINQQIVSGLDIFLLKRN